MVSLYFIYSDSKILRDPMVVQCSVHLVLGFVMRLFPQFESLTLQVLKHVVGCESEDSASRRDCRSLN